MDDIKKENERSKFFSEEKQNPPINTPQSASHKPEPSLQPHDLKESDEQYTGKKAEQIAFPANPFWYDKYGEFFSSSWCPLYGEIPESFKADNLTKQCVRIIEESRNIWQCFPQPDIKYSEWKLKLAQEMWNLFYTHFTSIFESQIYKDGTVDLECMRIINWTRKIPTLELKELADFEIVALFAVYVTWRALEDWLTVEKGESLAYLYPPFDEYSFVEEKMRIALLVLSHAKIMANQTRNKTNKEKTTQPEHKSEKQTETNVFRWSGGTWEITYDGKTIRPAYRKGLKYIHYLMHHPGKSIRVLELLQKGTSSEKAKQALIEKGKNTAVKEVSEFNFDDNSEEHNSMDKLSIQTYKEDNVTDDLSIEEYEQCLSHLKEQKEAAKLAGKIEDIKELQGKIEHVEKLLKTSKNKKGILRKFVGDEEKARKAVLDCIKRTLTMLETEHYSLWKHLKPPTITTGLYCKYSPTEEIYWILQ